MNFSILNFAKLCKYGSYLTSVISDDSKYNLDITVKIIINLQTKNVSVHKCNVKLSQFINL